MDYIKSQGEIVAKKKKVVKKRQLTKFPLLDTEKKYLEFCLENTIKHTGLGPNHDYLRNQADRIRAQIKVLGKQK